MDEHILHDLDEVQFGTRMRGYDQVEVDALLDRARREIDQLRTSLRRADERVELAEQQLADELDAARTARAEAEAGIATAVAESADLRAAADAEIRTAIEAGRSRMLDEIASLQADRDLLGEGIEVTAQHVAAHRDRLLRAVGDLRSILDDIEERPPVVSEPEPAATDPPARPPQSTVGQAAPPTRAVTRLRPVPLLPGGVGGREEDLDAFFADDGS